MTLTYISTSTPYTYVIGWSNLGVRYYGVRFAQDCDPKELWHTYFTSSQHVAEFCHRHGDPDVIQIRKIFSSAQSAQLWEHRVLRRLKVTQNDRWLNRTDNRSIAAQPGDLNPARRPEVRAKIRAGVLRWYETNDNPNLGKTWTQEEKQAWGEMRKGERNPFYGHKHSDHNIQLYSQRQQGNKNSFYGKKHTESVKQHLSQIRKGVLKPKVSCLCCRKEIGINGFPGHNNKCKIR